MQKHIHRSHKNEHKLAVLQQLNNSKHHTTSITSNNKNHKLLVKKKHNVQICTVYITILVNPKSRCTVKKQKNTVKKNIAIFLTYPSPLPTKTPSPLGPRSIVRLRHGLPEAVQLHTAERHQVDHHIHQALQKAKTVWLFFVGPNKLWLGKPKKNVVFLCFSKHHLKTQQNYGLK